MELEGRRGCAIVCAVRVVGDVGAGCLDGGGVGEVLRGGAGVGCLSFLDFLGKIGTSGHSCSQESFDGNLLHAERMCGLYDLNKCCKVIVKGGIEMGSFLIYL